MSARSAAYQSRITGRPADINYVVAGVKFDGFDEERGALLEAKGPGYATFVRMGGSDTAKGLVSQAERQLDATSRKLPIEWHFAEEIAALAVIKLFKFRDVTHISVIYTP
ncbi:Tox-REase-5 domain-containing protein [Luteolibacter luteus]|uniref:Tox-REase-5 domain-containing protein n=1 Tax=Luteolibacter luteus TaxID=2728835 RepID=A0A858RRH4_9BACT|nr:Tox-REase-5 domain-containing protein [Luteolibacter luteus]QJE99144.1 hypothetical protein HHL09_26305 [Luteolibacter luteus]